MKITLNLKRQISNQIKKHKMEPLEYSSKDAMVAIPEMEDAGGKPLFINSKIFNKIHANTQKGNK